MNPFVRLYDAPVEFLGSTAYVLLLAAVSILLAGRAWDLTMWLGNAWAFRHVDGKFGPQWEYAPPLALYGRVALVLFLASVECLLIAGIIYVLG